MSREVNSKRIKILDAAERIEYSAIYKVLNDAAGTDYAGWMKATWPDLKPERSFRFWFPKLAETEYGVDVPAVLTYINTISEDWNELCFIDQRDRSNETYEPYNGYVLIYAKDPKGGPYIFRGVFKDDPSKSWPGHFVCRRIGTKVKLIGQPAYKIEILDDFRKK
ncbi:MAG: hypothetical protein Q4C20_11645 [Erysipelotrichaceae bacterium]|nr:hypothetical protein [Erysipelotrichaceae bacterium]